MINIKRWALLGLIGAQPAFSQVPPLKSLPTPAPESTTQPADDPLPLPPRDPSQLGVGIQRTMTLLATSTPQHRNHVRVLFYGQSITEQVWSKQVAEDLRQRFPNADLEIENRAIGGFGSQMLIRPAEHDLYPFYPDLLIFHVFGANQQYEQIIAQVRSRTTAEVLMQTDRVAGWPPAIVDREKDKGSWWEDMMNHHFLPEIAAKYGCGLCDVHDAWLGYLKINHFEPRDLLLPDGAHLNARGNVLLARLTSRYLIYRPELPATPWKDLVHDESITDTSWHDGRLTMKWNGNRLDLLPAAGAAPGEEASILIDGKRPGEFPRAYRISRPTPGPWSPLFLSRVDHVASLRTEQWTLTLTSVAADGKSWKFDVSGSKTGADGSGESGQLFTSRSGRVQIDTSAWFRGFFPPLPVGYEMHWQVLPMFQDAYTSVKPEDPTKENAVTLIQGIDNGPHVMEMIARDPARPPRIIALRAYKPPLGEPANSPSTRPQ